MKLTIKLPKCWSYIAFLLGLLSANNIMYIFVVGTTPIYVSDLLAVFAFLVLVFNGKLPRKLNIPLSLSIFTLAVLVSFVPVILFNHHFLSLWLKGVLPFCFIIFTFLDVLILKDQKEQIVKGVLCGVILNFIVVAIELIYQSRGAQFNFVNVFPASGIASIWFRCQGLFREPGHLMRYMAVVFYLLYPYLANKNKVVRIFFFAIMLFMMAMTQSASIVFMILGLILLFYDTLKRNVAKVIGILITLCIIVFALYCMSDKIPILNSLFESLHNGLNDILSEGTKTDGPRIIGIKALIELINQYPLIGAGWNTAANLLYEMGLQQYEVMGAYSFALRLVLELGLGVLFMLWFEIKYFYRNFSSRNLELRPVGIAMFVYLLLSFATDYGFAVEVCILFAWAIVDRKETTHVYKRNCI